MSDRVLVNEMCALLRCGKGALRYMTSTGDVARPEIVRVEGRRVSLGGAYQRAWDRKYVEALLRDPTPAVARSIARARPTGPAEDHVGREELARMLGCHVSSLHRLCSSGGVDRPVPIPGTRFLGWPRGRVEGLLADPPDAWLREQTLRVGSLRAGGLVEAADVARALGVPVERLGDAERDGRLPRRVHPGGGAHGPLWRRRELEAHGLSAGPHASASAGGGAERPGASDWTRRNQTADGRRER